MTGQPLVAAESVTKRFGGAYALQDASFELRSGEIHALVGENGAGKSTLARILAGSEHPDDGEIRIEGQTVLFKSPLEAQAAGVAIIYQELDLFEHLSVGENIVIGNLRYREGRATSAQAVEAFCRPFLEQVGLSVDSRAWVGSLPIAQKQLVAIARALSMRCRVLLMDEPTSALSEDAAETMFKLIADLRNRGVGIVYVSHKVEEIFRLCDRLTVLRDGNSVGCRDIAGLDRAELVRLMVGRSLDPVSARTDEGCDRQTLFAARNLTTRRLRSLSFEVRAGEVLGVAGLVGAGRSELGRALVGLDKVAGGVMELKGGRYHPSGPADAQRRGVCLLPEDRKLEGLMLQMSVAENATLAVLPALGKAGLIHREAEQRKVEPLFRQLRLKSASPDIPVRRLSGGNQQKVLLARWLLADPDLMFLDDPARGIDVGAKEDIYRIIAELAASGKAVILASSELSELFRCCDRILVLNEGRHAGHFRVPETSQEEIIAAATRSHVELCA
jgi:ABC-type sugar transport system ATPase subunit